MKQIYANTIVEQDGVTHGIAGLDKTIVENLGIMYKSGMAQAIIQQFAKAPDAAYFFDQFCQFVVYVQFQRGIGLSMKISDFHGNTDLALDEYKKLQSKGWRKEDTDKIMKLCLAIESYTGEKAEIVIKDLVS
jgi:hypothetical protein